MRPYATGAAIPVVTNPAGATPQYLGALTLPGIKSQYEYSMTFDYTGRALYYFDTSTSPAVLWKVQ